MEMNFCRRCGTKLTKQDEGVYRCENTHMIFSNPAPTVGLFLLDGDSLILSVRGIEPNKGSLDCFGGFLDGKETFEQAIVREMKEETGLDPSDYSTPEYLTSATYEYEYGGELRSVVSNMYFARLNPGSTPRADDDVASLHRTTIATVSIDDIANSDVRGGFLALKARFA